MSRELKKLLIIKLLCLSLVGCSNLEEAEGKKLRQMNAHAEYIYRNQAEQPYQLTTPRPSPREKYPWEEKR